MEGLTRWHAVVTQRDASALPALVAEDAVFRSPALFATQEGRDLVVLYLTAAVAVLGPSIAYHRQWEAGSSAVLEFTATVGDREVHGVDMIEWDEEGLIRDFAVMVRPLSALNALMEAMAAELGRMHTR